MILKFEDFINEANCSIYYWEVTQDEEGEDTHKVKYQFKKGDTIRVTDYAMSGSAGIVNHKGRNYHINDDILPYFAKRIET